MVHPNCPDDLNGELPLVEQTLLWSMRVWVVCQHMPAADVLQKIAAAFADLGTPACANFLDGFMWALRHGAQRTIGIDCPCRPNLEQDERILLRVFALVQRGDNRTAAALLHGMVAQVGIRAAVHSAGLMGAELAQAGRWMKPRLPRVNEHKHGASGGEGHSC